MPPKPKYPFADVPPGGELRIVTPRPDTVRSSLTIYAKRHGIPGQFSTSFRSGNVLIVRRKCEQS